MKLYNSTNSNTMHYKFPFILLFSVILFFGCKNSKTTEKELNADFILNKINKSEKVEIVSSEIRGNIDFTSVADKYTRNPNIGVAEIDVPLVFVDCHFTDSISGFRIEDKYAYVCVFNKPVTFMNCTFDKDVNFRQNSFNDVVEFTGCTFSGEVKFEGAVFYANDAFFRDNTYEKKVKFTNSSFYGNVTFMNGLFQEVASFNNCFFNRNSNFSNCNFKNTSNFENIQSNGFFKLNYSIFDQKVYFSNCNFQGRTEFVKIHSKLNFTFNDCTVNNFLNFNESVFKTELYVKNNLFLQNNTNFENLKKSSDCKFEISDNKIITSQIFEFEISDLQE